VPDNTITCLSSTVTTTSKMISVFVHLFEGMPVHRFSPFFMQACFSILLSI
jgi:hypothetical protein